GIERGRLRRVARASHLRKLCAHQAWKDLRHADLAEVVETEGFGEAVDRKFTRDIRGAAAISSGGGVGADVDDMTVLALEHERDDCAGDPHHASDVCLDRGEHIFDRLMIEGSAAADIVTG